MVEVNIRDKNRIITLLTPGKAPIKSRSGGMFFYNSMELLCISIGACFGGELQKYCQYEDINPSSFESISIKMDNFKPRIILQYPKEMSKEVLDDIRRMARTCQISKLLKEPVEIELAENSIPTERLIDETKPRPCCGS